MTKFQELWWLQARSDHEVFELLRERRVNPCHQLHYLQMATEKLAKAYFWRGGSPSKTTHIGLMTFLKALSGARRSERVGIARSLAFGRFSDFERWVRLTSPLAYNLENITPAHAKKDHPNPEYPWPHDAPTWAPVTYSFEVWTDLNTTGRGRQLLTVVSAAIRTFPGFA